MKNEVKRKIKYLIKKRHFIKKSNNPIKWGVIGTGYMANCFCNAIEGSSDGVLYSVASRDLKKAISFSKDHGSCMYFCGYKNMVNELKNILDVVYIATPLYCHFEHISYCLEKGVNVICEKPIVENTEQFEILEKIAKKNNCFLMEAMWMKCLPTYTKAKTWLEEGKIGDIKYIRVDFYKKDLFKIKKNESVLKDFGVYAIAFPIGLIKQNFPLEILYCRNNSVANYDSDWQIILKYSALNVAISISNNFNSSSKAEVIGCDGSIEWDNQFNRTNKITLYDKDGNIKEKFNAKYSYEGFEYEVMEVNKSIRMKHKESDLVTLKDTKTVLQIIDFLLEEN